MGGLLPLIYFRYLLPLEVADAHVSNKGPIEYRQALITAGELALLPVPVISDPHDLPFYHLSLPFYLLRRLATEKVPNFLI